MPRIRNVTASFLVDSECPSFPDIGLHRSLWAGSWVARVKVTAVGIARSKRDGTRAETRYGLSAKRTSPFKSTGASVQSTTRSRGVRISGSNDSNAGYTMF